MTLGLRSASTFRSFSTRPKPRDIPQPSCRDHQIPPCRVGLAWAWSGSCLVRLKSLHRIAHRLFQLFWKTRSTTYHTLLLRFREGSVPLLDICTDDQNCLRFITWKFLDGICQEGVELFWKLGTRLFEESVNRLQLRVDRQASLPTPFVLLVLSILPVPSRPDPLDQNT